MNEKQEYEWFEELVENCPLEGAFPVDGETYYRLGNNPPSDGDFLSYRILYPLKSFQVTECQARSLSVFNTLEMAEEKRKLPNLRKKNFSIIAVSLTTECGLLKQTGDEPNHYSWWRSKAFNIQNCKVI